MNIGKEPQSSINESNSVSVLKLRLQENGLIKCYFGEGEKTPNTDGFFVVNNEVYPLKEFHVQIKTTDVLNETKGMKVYSCDTKFINYANLRVTENPCFIFIIELQTQTIYFKYLSEKFLQENDFTHNEQKNISIHFSDSEILDNVETFYKLVCDIIKYREIKSFNPANIDILEYQTAFDLLNNFFDKDFIKIKNLLYPNIWKFGIAYQRTSIENLEYQALMRERAKIGIEAAPYVSSFGAYAIEYGDNKQIFQNIDVFENDKTLKLLYNLSSTNGIVSTVEEAALKWLSSVFELWISNESVFVRFLPNEALFEVVYNFLDKNAFESSRMQNKNILVGNTIATSEAKRIITERYPQKNYINGEIVLLLNSLFEIERRKIDTINRVWVFESMPKNHIRNIYYQDIQSIIDNNIKLFENLPKYYNEFIKNLFGENIANVYAYKGAFKIKLEIDLVDNYFKNEYRSIIYDSNEFIIDVVDDINDTDALRNWGVLHTSFKGDKINILTNILSILYKQVCKRFKFKEDLLFTSKGFIN